MKSNKLLLSTIISVLLFAGCKKDQTPSNTDMTAAEARDDLYSILQDWYYWYEVMPSVNKDDYADPYLLMEAMRYKALDRWSFVADYDEFMAEMQGVFVGHGFRLGLDNENKARIVLIYDHSPLYLQGVRRSWIVKKINDKDVAPVLMSQDPTAYNNLIGPSEAGVTNKFLFETPAGKDSVIMSTKTSFTLNSVLMYDTLHLSSGITGHIVFESFITPSESELAEAFAYFKATGVTDLILDLRYNSGGYLYIAQQLASYIAGNTLNGSQFINMVYNNKHQGDNNAFNFITTASPLGLTRLVVITSRETASASECVMNGLKPYIDVVSIGDTTNGKPVGMDGGDIGKKYFIAPVTFKSVNKDNQSDYFEGLAPLAIVEDDITRDFNSREELCLRAATEYLENGSISTKGMAMLKRSRQFSEKPAYLGNSFVIRDKVTSK